MSSMVRTSRISGTLRSTHSSSASSSAAIIGSAAFLLPLTVTEPRISAPPFTLKLCMNPSFPFYCFAML